MSISEWCFLYSECLKHATGKPAEPESVAIFFVKWFKHLFASYRCFLWGQAGQNPSDVSTFVRNTEAGYGV